MGLIWAKNPVVGHVGPEWAKCPYPAHVGPVYTNYFYCFEINVDNMAVTRKRPHRQRAKVCHFVSYIL